MAGTRRSAGAGWRGGLQVGASLGAGTLALAVSFGAFATLHGWPPAVVIAMSLVVFSGSAQFAMVTSMAGGGGLTTGLTAAALINTRFIPMAAAAASSLRGGPLRRSLEGQAVVDGSWVSAQRPEGGFDREKMIGATLVQWPAWVVGTAIGAVFVPSTEFIHRTGLDLVFPCFFLLLLLDALRSRRDHRLVALVAVDHRGGQPGDVAGPGAADLRGSRLAQPPARAEEAAMTAMIIAIVVLAVMNFAFKAIGPALLGDREFPPRVQTVIEAFSPALLAGLLVVELVGQHWALFDWTTLPGLLAAAVGWRLGAPHLACIAVGVAVTVLARLAGTLL